MEFEPIIGLEIHVQPKTKSKMFCRCRAEIFGEPPNTHVCPVCLGLPGALPVINETAIDKTVVLGLALNCQISKYSKFDRKNYFYPDLPKGYQISQYDMPIAIGGSLKFPPKADQPLAEKVKSEKLKVIRIRRVHLEEDTAKIIHKKKYSLIDFNRCGIPLIEIVTEPDLRSVKEVGLFLRNLQLIIRNLRLSDAEMARGTMRLEPNISVREVKSQKSKVKSKEEYPDYKVEVKNINSFKFVEKAVSYEIERQIKLLKRNKKIKQETRGWDEKGQITVRQRGKEEAQEYRYFPEPDLPPLKFEKEEIEGLRLKLPKLPEQKIKKYKLEFKLPGKYIKILIKDETLADYMERAVLTGLKPVVVADIIINRPSLRKIPPLRLKEYLRNEKKSIVSDKHILIKYAKEVINENPKAVKDFKDGKETALKFLIGQIMKKSKGKADPKLSVKILNKKLKR